MRMTDSNNKHHDKHNKNSVSQKKEEKTWTLISLEPSFHGCARHEILSLP